MSSINDPSLVDPLVNPESLASVAALADLTNLTNVSSFTALYPELAPLRVQRHSEKGKLPTRGSRLAAGYDLYAAEASLIPAGGKALVNTDISIAVPEGTYGRVAPRSGLASKHSIHTGAGVIDADYRGKVHVLLFNLGKEDFQVNEGDRIAQLVLERIVNPEVTEVEVLPETERGAGGFGSTGGITVPTIPTIPDATLAMPPTEPQPNA